MNWKYYFRVMWYNWLLQFNVFTYLHYLVKSVVGNPFIESNCSETRFQQAEQICDLYLRYGNKPLNETVCFEFGAGRELFISMSLGAFGFSKIHASDLFYLIRPDWLQKSAKKIKERIDYPKGESAPVIDQQNCLNVLSNVYHLDYMAPQDARATPFDDNSIDFVFSNSVLEHLSWDVYRGILKECHRILKPEGIIVFTVAYWDHEADGKSISPYHFLRFSEKRWKKYTPTDHGHNRKRHIDYRNLFAEMNFDILQETCITPYDLTSYTEEYRKLRRLPSAERLIGVLKETPLADEFKHYSMEELAVLSGIWIVKKPA